MLHRQPIGGKVADESSSELIWYRDPRCESGACVEVSVDGDTVLVRSSMHPGVAPVTLSHDEWDAFIAGIKGGAFDLI